MRENLERRISVYERQLTEPAGLAGRQYWASRGFSRYSAERFRIGFVAEPEIGDRFYAGRLCIPYLTQAGPVGMKYRAVEGSGGEKYLYDKGAIHRIFNPSALTESTFVVITEGEMDAVSFEEAGVPAIGIPGASAFKLAWRRALYNRDIVVFCDGDEPGIGFGEGLTSKLYGSKMVVAPDGEDANSILQQHGPDRLREMVGLK